MPGLVANALEFRQNFLPTIEERNVMQKLYKYSEMEEFKPNINKKGQDKFNRKMLVVVVAYMMRLPEIDDPAIARCKESVLKLAPALVEMMFEAAFEI